jgi:TonB family protein
MGLSMSTNPTMNAPSEKQSDRLLWLAAAAVAGMGVTWLVISQPWSSGISAPVVIAPPAVSTTPPPPVTESSVAPAETPLSSGLDDPLRMAQLAYEAGMLTEPEDYSAWTLFAGVLVQDPGNAIALEGLDKVAADLLQRGAVALEQGRYDDARATVDRILGALPDHEGATALALRVQDAAPKPDPEPVVEVEPVQVIVAAPRPEPVREEPKIDLVLVAHDAFDRAMRENRLLTPANDNARLHVKRMIDENPAHELAIQDRDLLVTELLARSRQALEALDPDAARTWIDEAERIAADQAPIAAARTSLTDGLIAMETAKPLPASALTVVDYVAPEYPRYAATRGLEGWVDVEFIVTSNGSTRDIAVADASHERYFREEAMAAVSQWHFEPRIFMDRPIDQKTYTRVRFVLTR